MNTKFFLNMQVNCWKRLHKREIPSAQCRNIQLVAPRNSKQLYKQTKWSHKSQMKNKQEKNHMCTSMGHMSIGFNNICGHPQWQQLRNTMVTKLTPSISSKLLIGNHDVLVLMENLYEPTFMIGLHIKEKLKPNMSTQLNQAYKLKLRSKIYQYLKIIQYRQIQLQPCCKR